jgi:hypothetical protein
MKWKHVQANCNSIIMKFTLYMCISSFTMVHYRNSRTPYDITAGQAELSLLLISQQAAKIHWHEQL